jgi:RNA-binding protein FUS
VSIPTVSNSYAPPNNYGPPGSYSAQGGGDRGARLSGYDSNREEKPGGYPEPRANPTRNDPRNVTSSYDVQPDTIKQYDENCRGNCDNCRFTSPLDVTSDELRDLFGEIGQVGRIKQKRGYKDQWPRNTKIYTDDAGNNKGDAVLSYEDPSATHSAGGFYNDYMMRGHK